MIHLGRYECRWLVIVLFTMATAAFTHVTAIEQAPVTVFVTAELDPGNALKVTLENRGNEPIRIYAHDLPWRSSSSFIVIAVDAESGSILRQLRPIDDPGDKEEVIMPNQHLQGTIRLNQRFPNLSELSARKEVILFWTYRAPLIGENRPQRVSGWISVAPRE